MAAESREMYVHTYVYLARPGVERGVRRAGNEEQLDRIRSVLSTIITERRHEEGNKDRRERQDTFKYNAIFT